MAELIRSGDIPRSLLKVERAELQRAHGGIGRVNAGGMSTKEKGGAGGYRVGRPTALRVKARRAEARKDSKEEVKRTN